MSLNPYRPQRVGNLRDRIVWQEKMGDTWLDRQTEPGRVEPLKGVERFDADVSTRYATANYRVFTRYRHVPDTANWRLLWVTGHKIPDGDAMVAERLILDIESAINIDERRRFLEMVVTNTDTSSAPEIEQPPAGGDGTISNSGNPFTSTAGWYAISGGGADLSVHDGHLRLGDYGDAVTEIETTIGANYRFTVEFAATYGETVLAFSNDPGGWPWGGSSDPVGVPDEETSGTFTLDFTATAATTYLLFEGPMSDVVLATCEKLA